MRYLFDTSILIHYIRESDVYQYIESTFLPFQTGNFPCISVVSVGEIRSFAIQRKWGALKLQKLENFLAEFVLLDINHDVVIERYAEIDAFSQNLLPGRQLGLTARNMGKNDIWIAATAAVANAVLLTTDADFDHLNNVFLKLEKITI